MCRPGPPRATLGLAYADELCDAKLQEHPMRVIRAEAMGMCFGVRDALEIMEGLANPSEVTVHGELVHNAEVQGRLETRGFRTLGESERAETVPVTPFVLVTAHGISDAERRRLRAAGRELIDTTCPLV